MVEGVTGTYIHGGGAAGVVASFRPPTALRTRKRSRNTPKYLHADCGNEPHLCLFPLCSQNVLDTEKEILLAQIKNDPKLANKPEAVIEKMISGRLTKFYETNCLNEQSYVKDEEKKVKTTPNR